MKIGRLRNTWRRVLKADVEEAGYNWRQLKRLAQDRNAWRNVGGLCHRRANVANERYKDTNKRYFGISAERFTNRKYTNELTLGLYV